MDSLRTKLSAVTAISLTALALAACQSSSMSDATAPVETAEVEIDVNNIATWPNLIAPETASAIASYSPTSIAALPPVAQPIYPAGYQRVSYGRGSLDEQFEQVTNQYLGPDGEAQRIRSVDANGVTTFEYSSRGDWWWYPDEWRRSNGESGGSNFTNGDLDAIFPLVTGNVAMVEYSGVNADGSPYGGPRFCGVMGAESVTTPSGTYSAMRVECRSGGNDVETLLNNAYRVHVMWISPETGDVVAYVDQADNELRRTWYVDS